MRELASVGCAVLVSLGLLLGLSGAIHAARPDLAAQTRSTRLDSASRNAGQAVAASGRERAEARPLAAPGRAVMVRVLTLDVRDPWRPEPVALRRPAWNAAQEQRAVEYGDYAVALRSYDALAELGAGGDPWSNKLAEYDLTVATRDHYAYVATGDAGLRILDYSAPAGARRQRFLATPGAAEAVLVAGDQAYVVVVQRVLADGRDD
jgi:hypothetical protein